MKKTISTLPLLALLSIVSCVTINIYFPAAAAEKAADKIIKDIQEGAETETPTDAPQSSLLLYRTKVTVLEIMSLGISTAHAAADLNVDSPEIRAIRASMKRRFPKLKEYLDKGWIGYASNGLVAVVNPSAIPPQLRAKVMRLVQNENKDRRALYQAIARANGHPEWADEIQATFAKRWIANARPGWMIQATNGGWQRK